MEPGIYSGLPIDKYHGDPDSISTTGIKNILRSPAHFKSFLDKGGLDEPSFFRTGTALHASILEPGLFRSRYVKGPCLSRSSKDFKLFQSANLGKIILKDDEYSDIVGMTKSVNNNSNAGKLLSLSGGVAEESIFWIDATTGVKCRCRPDLRRNIWTDPDTGRKILTLVDVKTTEDARPVPFKRSVKKFGYDIQDAFYCDGAAQAFEVDEVEFVFVAIEKKPPYGVMVHILDNELVHEGREKYRKALEQYSECRSSGHWPGYREEINIIY